MFANFLATRELWYFTPKFKKQTYLPSHQRENWRSNLVEKTTKRFQSKTSAYPSEIGTIGILMTGFWFVIFCFTVYGYGFVNNMCSFFAASIIRNGIRIYSWRKIKFLCQTLEFLISLNVRRLRTCSDVSALKSSQDCIFKKIFRLGLLLSSISPM